MHKIDKQWTELASGYQAIQSFNEKLTVEFGRAVQVGHHQRFRQQLTDWQKKRRIFFSMIGVAALAMIGLCLTAYFYREVACVLVYWVMLVTVILVTLAVAGRQYVVEMVNGRPEAPAEQAGRLDLEGCWWENLAPREVELAKVDKKEALPFVTLLARSLPDPYCTRPLAEHSLLLLGPSGIWLLNDVNWEGTLVKQEGAWKQTISLRDKVGRKRLEEKVCEPAPDDGWLRQKQELVKRLEERLPLRAWVSGHIKGGVVFSHPQVVLDKKNIQGNTASFGTSKGWIERIRHAPEVDGFTVELQLEILDALREEDGIQKISSRDEAEKLYLQEVIDLRAEVRKLVDKQ